MSELQNRLIFGGDIIGIVMAKGMYRGTVMSGWSKQKMSGATPCRVACESNPACNGYTWEDGNVEMDDVSILNSGNTYRKHQKKLWT